jgi:DNA-directed RNA polymerase subunit RPC12/RpoP
MRLLRDFKCPECDTTFERFIDSETSVVSCSCGHLAQRIIGMPRVTLDGTDPGFPGAYDHWARIREDNARQKARKEQ